MFDTLPGTLVAPLVAGGTEVRFFAWLENSSMAAAFRGRRPMGHPAFAALDDRQLARGEPSTLSPMPKPEALSPEPATPPPSTKIQEPAPTPYQPQAGAK